MLGLEARRDEVIVLYTSDGPITLDADNLRSTVIETADGRIVIEVSIIERHKVRVGIEAPESVRIRREPRTS